MTPATPAGSLQRARFALAASVAAVALSASLVLPQTAQAAPTTTAAAAPTVAEMTQRVVTDTNAVRAEQGLPALVRDPRLDKVAADWARQQWVNGAMSHNPNFSTQIPPGWQRAGENVGKGYTYTQLVPAWRASSTHYANLVNDYTSVGVGYYEQDGRRYWSQVFAKYPGVTPAPAPTPTPSGSAGSSASPAPEPAAPAGTALALSSPSFESGLGTWSAPGGTIDGPNANARGGARSLLVPGAASRVVAQTVQANVAAGSTHTLTVYVKADGAASGTVRLRTLGGTAESGAVAFTASASGWLKVSIALTAKAAHTGFVVEVVTGQSGRSYRIDSVSLVRTGEPTPATTTSTSSTQAAPSPAPTPAPSPAPAPAPTPAPTPTPAPAPAPTPSRTTTSLLGGLLLG